MIGILLVSLNLELNLKENGLFKIPNKSTFGVLEQELRVEGRVHTTNLKMYSKEV